MNQYIMIISDKNCQHFFSNLTKLKHLQKLWGIHSDAAMTKFSTNPYSIFQCSECYTTLIVKELPYNKIQIILLLF